MLLCQVSQHFYAVEITASKCCNTWQHNIRGQKEEGRMKAETLLTWKVTKLLTLFGRSLTANLSFINLNISDIRRKERSSLLSSKWKNSQCTPLETRSFPFPARIWTKSCCFWYISVGVLCAIFWRLAPSSSDAKMLGVEVLVVPLLRFLTNKKL